MRHPGMRLLALTAGLLLVLCATPVLGQAAACSGAVCTQGPGSPGTTGPGTAIGGPGNVCWSATGSPAGASYCPSNPHACKVKGEVPVATVGGVMVDFASHPAFTNFPYTCGIPPGPPNPSPGWFDQNWMQAGCIQLNVGSQALVYVPVQGTALANSEMVNGQCLTSSAWRVAFSTPVGGAMWKLTWSPVGTTYTWNWGRGANVPNQPVSSQHSYVHVTQAQATVAVHAVTTWQATLCLISSSLPHAPCSIQGTLTIGPQGQAMGCTTTANPAVVDCPRPYASPAFHVDQVEPVLVSP